ncbi:MAG: hypothetical protein CFE37_04740 [Alphaproteobacteria bacterium PA4]|nr:MAG: hypothetical protein CFE37_04740 [Alphaproteobacteria bacterium PA4]
MRAVLALFALVLATAAAPAPDPLLQQILAGARAVPPASTAWERTQKQTGKDADGGASETHVQVDRWDGQQLVRVSSDGKPPSAEATAQYKKATAGKPVPGYHRIADYLKAGAVRGSDAQGRIVYRVTGLPKGSINIGKDISANLVAEALVDSSGPQPFVSRLRIMLPKPLSFLFIAKLDSFEVVNDYRMINGKPTLVHQTQAMSGSQMGSAGSTRSESTYTPLR